MRRPSVSTRMPACMFSISARRRLVAMRSTISVRLRSVMSLRVPDTPSTTPPSSKAMRWWASTHFTSPVRVGTRNSPSKTAWPVSTA